MVKKKQIAEKWVVLDENDQVHHYSNFNEALKHPGGKRARIMTDTKILLRNFILMLTSNMKILLENDKGYVIVDDSTSKIISVIVHNAVEGKRDFVNLASFKNNTDGTQTAIRFCANHQRDLDWNEEETNKRMDIIGQNGNTGEHYELLDQE
jgi:hypothetical protein